MKCAKAAILIPLGICVIIGFASLWEETKPHVLAAYTSATTSDIIFWLLVGLTLSMTIGVFFLLHKHNRLLNGSKDDIPTLSEEVKGIGLYVRIIAYIAIIVCLFIALHYLCVQHARVLTFKGDGADYIGVIVGIMSAMITLLVGWNIYSTIKAKEELKDAKVDIENRFAKRLDKFDECCEIRGEEIASLRNDIEARLAATKHTIESENLDRNQYFEARIKFGQGLNLMLLADFESMLNPNCLKSTQVQGQHNQPTRQYKFQYCIAYKNFAEALLFYIRSNGERTAIDACLSNMRICLKQIKISADNGGTERFSAEIYAKCNTIYNDISNLNWKPVYQDIKEQFEEIHAIMSEIETINLRAHSDFVVVSGDEVDELMRKVRAKIQQRKAELKAKAEQDKQSSNTDTNPPATSTEQ